MLIRRAERFTYSDVTPYPAYLDRRTFMRLVRTGPTLARIEHTLETGKPLRN